MNNYIKNYSIMEQNMAERSRDRDSTRNSGSITSNHIRGPSIGRGWEEAKQEFYQEAFHTVSSTGEGDLHKSVEAVWETILPSQRTKIIGIFII